MRKTSGNKWKQEEIGKKTSGNKRKQVGTAGRKKNTSGNISKQEENSGK